MELIGLFLFIGVFGAICNALKPVIKQRGDDWVAEQFRQAQKKQADHLSTARPFLRRG